MLWPALLILMLLSVVAPLAFLLHLPHLRQLADVEADPRTAWPSVTAIVPARDEADRIGPALTSRLADDYPNLEMVVIDDRSTDGTGDAARAVAAADTRVRVLRVHELPPGWLGKTHALHDGVARASGEWLLFSDADVHMEVGALRKAVSFALAEKVDCLALIPSYGTGSTVFEALWAHFLVILGALLDPAAVARPASKAVVGSGAFTLVRREAFDRTPGFEYLRLETGDDMALAQMLKRYGARCAVLGGRGEVSVAIYRSLAEFLRGIEKNGSSTLGPPYVVLAMALGVAVAADFVPFAALVTGPGWLRLIAVGILGVQTLAHALALRSNTGRWVPGLLWPMGTPLMAFGLLRSAWLVRRRGGVKWRGTFYSNEELLAGRRYRF
ncbi:MAG: glycosyltransferase [Actinobacteria bacterium]|nr:MAG: glycosyltransferase [Actinomycetota bacterium]